MHGLVFYACLYSPLHLGMLACILLYCIWQSIQGGERPRFSQIFSPITKAFLCMFCMLVALIHYSDENDGIHS